MREELLRALARTIVRFPWLIVILTLAITAIAALNIPRLSINSQVNSFDNYNGESHRRYAEYLKEFGNDEFYIIIQADKIGRRVNEVAESLAAKIKTFDNVENVRWKNEGLADQSDFLLRIPSDKLQLIKKIFAQEKISPANLATWNNLSTMVNRITARLTDSSSSDREIGYKYILGFINNTFDNIMAVIRDGSGYHSKLEELFFTDDNFDSEGLIKESGFYFIFIKPRDISALGIEKTLILKLRAAIEEVESQYPDIFIGLSGQQVISFDATERLTRSILITSIIALALEALFLLILFRDFWKMLAGIASVSAAVTMAMGFTSIAFGSVNSTSILSLIIISAIGFQFVVYMMVHHRNALAGGMSSPEATEEASAKVGIILISATLILITAFTSIAYTSFIGAHNLGVICSAGTLFSLATTLTLLPAILSITYRSKTEEELSSQRVIFIPFFLSPFKAPKIFIAISIVGAVVFSWAAFLIDYDDTLGSSIEDRLDSLETEQVLVERTQSPALRIHSVANTINDSLEKANGFRELPSVKAVKDVWGTLPDKQTEKIAILKDIATSLTGIAFSEASDSIDVKRLIFELGLMAADLEIAENEAFKGEHPDEVNDINDLTKKIRELILAISDSDDATVAKLGIFQRDLLTDLQVHLLSLARAADLNTVSLTDMPTEIVSSYKSPSGRYAISVFPKDDIWDISARAKFVDEVKTVDERAFGLPVEMDEALNLFRPALLKVTLITIICTIIILAIDLRSIACVIPAALVSIFAPIWALGLLGLFHFKIGLTNFFAIPIIVGVAAVLSLGVIRGFENTRSYDKAIKGAQACALYSSIALILPFIALLFTACQSLSTFGIIASIGVASSLALTLFFAPIIASKLLKIKSVIDNS